MLSRIKLIDSHAHLQFPQFDSDRAEVIARLRAAGVGVINVGTDLATSRAAVQLAEAYEDMWATVGLHPTDVKEGFDYDAYVELSRHEKVVAIGECGLDYFRGEKNNFTAQAEIFVQQIELANELNKPLMLHIRDAYLAAYEILNSHARVKGNVHFFAGDWPTARRFLALGFTLSFTGVITFSSDYNEVVKHTPLDQILIETDCPFAAPSPHRGKRNEPVWVTLVNERVAAIKDLTAEESAAATKLNTCRLFALC